MVNLVSYLVLQGRHFFPFCQIRSIYCYIEHHHLNLWLQMKGNLMKYNKKLLFAVFLLATLVAGFYEHVHYCVPIICLVATAYASFSIVFLQELVEGEMN